MRGLCAPAGSAFAPSGYGGQAWRVARTGRRPVRAALAVTSTDSARRAGTRGSLRATRHKRTGLKPCPYVVEPGRMM